MKGVRGFLFFAIGACFYMIGVFPRTVYAQAPVLENPPTGSFQSGIGIISGWTCSANIVEIVIDNAPPLQAGYGTTREDTRAVCGDANDGFSLLWNWNLSGPGLHRVRAFVNGVQFADVTFTVTTLGGEFLPGVSGTYTLTNFPQAGTNTSVRWQESAQNFVIATGAGGGSGYNGGSRRRLENPSVASFQSGIGVISGWACEATTITIVIDDAPPLQAGYGTTREDTNEICGDANNGFSLLWNWNLSGPGLHRVRALADGLVFADVTFSVTTLGSEFLHGVSGTYTLENFPQAGTTVTITWQESAQNFAISAFSGGGAELSVAPPSLTFGTVAAKQSKDLSFTATNSGAATLAVTSVAVASDSSPFFSILPPASFSLTAGMHQDVFVRLQADPSAPSGVPKTIPASGRVNIISTGGVQSVELVGNFVDVIPAAASSVSPSRIDFSPTPVGFTRGVLFQLTNAGLYAPLTFSLIVPPPFGLVGPGGQLVDHGSVQLNPGVSLNFGVLFRPTHTGTFAEGLTVIINSDGSDATEVFLSGTGTGAGS